MEDLTKTPVTISEQIDDALRNSEIITQAIKKAVKLALHQHKLAGNSIVIGHNGKVVIIPASEIPDQVLE